MTVPRTLAAILIAPMIGAVMPARATEVPMDTAVLRALDKVSARVSTLKVPVGVPVAFGRLEITVQRCLARPPEETPESSVFLDITKQLGDTPREQVFQGWMFASSPDLSAMEDAVYDVWVLRCENSAASSASNGNG